MDQIKLLAIVSVFSFSFLNAQNLPKNIRTNQIQVSILDSTKVIYGNLYTADAELILISGSNLAEKSNLMTIEAKNIRQIIIIRKENIFFRMLIGTLAGSAIGTVITLATNNNDDEILTFWKNTYEAVVFIGGGEVIG